MSIPLHLSASLAGLLEDRPEVDAENPGRFYFATDENQIYRDSGTAWVKVALAQALAAYLQLTSTLISLGATSSPADNAITIGQMAHTAATSSLAIGPGANAFAEYSNAIGPSAMSNIGYTTMIAGPIINMKDNAGWSPWLAAGGVRCVLASPRIDWKTAATFQLDLPGGCHFYPEEISIVVTHWSNVSVQPTISFGDAGNTAKLLAATQLTGLSAVHDRTRFTSLLSGHGVTALTAQITNAATASFYRGRYFFSGLLVEDHS